MQRCVKRWDPFRGAVICVADSVFAISGDTDFLSHDVSAYAASFRVVPAKISAHSHSRMIFLVYLFGLQALRKLLSLIAQP